MLKGRKSLIVVLWKGKLVLQQNKAVCKLGAEGVNTIVIFRCKRFQMVNSSRGILFIQVSRVTQHVCKL